MDMFGLWTLDADHVRSVYQYFQMNKIELFDNLFLIDIPSYTGTFYHINKQLTTVMHKDY